MRELYAQGDVLIERVADIPITGTPIAPAADGAVVLAEGEVTGHRHVIYDNVQFFRDDGRPEYAYRLIYFHKTKGKLAGPWQGDSSGYIYASIPDDILENQEFKTRAEQIVEGVIDKVLDKLGKAAAGIGGGQR